MGFTIIVMNLAHTSRCLKHHYFVLKYHHVFIPFLILIMLIIYTISGWSLNIFVRSFLATSSSPFFEFMLVSTSL